MSACAPNDRKDLITVAPATGVETTLTYLVPKQFSGKTVPGLRVLVPLGRRVVTGFIVEAGGSYHGHIKEIIDLLDAEPIFDDGSFRFFRFLADYYGAPLGEVIRKALPGGFTIQTRRIVRTVSDYTTTDEMERRIIELAGTGRGITVGSLMKRLGTRGVSYRLDKLSRAGAVAIEDKIGAGAAPRRGERVVTMREGEPSEECAKVLARSPKMKRIIESIGEDREVLYAQLTRRWGSVSNQIRRLVELGAVDVSTRYREKTLKPPDMSVIRPDELSPSQQRAIERIEDSFSSGGFSPYLLYGVTGSGKTEVYIRAVQRALEAGRGALVLVPEISLTPQLTARFVSCLGDTVALFHSSLSDAERLDQWWRVKTKKARVVIGARSALFAPLIDPGVIIVDEEHDPSYKQSETPRYHARDAAVMLGRIKNAVVILGSATPSLETLYNARTGRYTLLTLPERVTKVGRLPVVEIVNMREAAMATRNITEQLAGRLSGVVGAGRQAILLLNRRGFSSFVLCRTCGHNFPCPSCSITLTYHKGPRTLLCHYCDHEQAAPDTCPGCGGADLILMGAGVERVQEELCSIVPNARILRLDRDAAKKKGEIEKILSAFSGRRADILIGTQMVAKGHDFPDVTLVGIINADIALNLPDFRAGERTFTLLTQAAGRAGRGNDPSTVVIQTYNPDHYAIVAASSHDFEGFSERELIMRSELSYPPFSRLALIRIAGPDLEEVHSRSLLLGDTLRAVIADKKISVTPLGPAPSPIARIKDRYRYQIMLKSTDRRSLFELLGAVSLIGGPTRRGGVSIVVDIDPIDML